MFEGERRFTPWAVAWASAERKLTAPLGWRDTLAAGVSVTSAAGVISRRGLTLILQPLQDQRAGRVGPMTASNSSLPMDQIAAVLMRDEGLV